MQKSMNLRRAPRRYTFRDCEPGQEFRDGESKMRTFGENQTNRRLILSKVSWVYILRRELLQGRRYRPT
jgi:hypothetical protein